MRRVFQHRPMPHHNSQGDEDCLAFWGAAATVLGMRIVVLLLALVPLAHLQESEDLGPYRAAVDSFRDVPAAATWVAGQSKRLDAEEAFRSSTALPLCQATWGLEQAREVIAHEKANPGGVVDLEALHGAGVTVQYCTAAIAALKPAYVAFRKKPFVKWESEGVCVSEARK